MWIRIRDTVFNNHTIPNLDTCQPWYHLQKNTDRNGAGGAGGGGVDRERERLNTKSFLGHLYSCSHAANLRVVERLHGILRITGVLHLYVGKGRRFLGHPDVANGADLYEGFLNFQPGFPGQVEGEREKVRIIQRFKDNFFLLEAVVNYPASEMQRQKVTFLSKTNTGGHGYIRKIFIK
jgi:hypothetical protein